MGIQSYAALCRFLTDDLQVIDLQAGRNIAAVCGGSKAGIARMSLGIKFNKVRLDCIEKLTDLFGVGFTADAFIIRCGVEIKV